MTQYTDTFLDHYRNPRNAEVIEGADGVGQVENAACGDTLQLYLQIGEGRIVRAAFQTYGCPAAIAASSMLTEMIRGTTLEEAGQIDREDVAAALGGVPPMKRHCLVLAEDGLRAALKDYQSEND